MPPGQNGADVGTYISTAAGTNPTFSNQQVVYYLSRLGRTEGRYSLSNSAGGTPGNGANAIYFHFPLAAVVKWETGRIGNIYNGTDRNPGEFTVSTGNNFAACFYDHSGTNLVQNDFNHANTRRVQGKFTYPAF